MGEAFLLCFFFKREENVRAIRKSSEVGESDVSILGVGKFEFNTAALSHAILNFVLKYDISSNLGSLKFNAKMAEWI